MSKYELNDIDSEDLGDILAEVESSFGINFVGNELVEITTFGELCDHIKNKIQLENSEDCTRQQAFYKLRNSISMTLSIENKKIIPNLKLLDFLPRQNRRLTINKLEKNLGFKLNILSPPNWVTLVLTIISIVSLVMIFFNWKIGLLGFFISVVGFRLAKNFGNELNVNTIGEVVEKMTRENYLKSRRNMMTFNQNEIEKLLSEWFIIHFDLDESKLTRDSRLVK